MTGIIGSLILGLIAGFIASKLQTGSSSGLLINMFLGLQANGLIGSLICAVVGAVIVLWVFAKLR